jgi:hypothetical protein
MSKLNNDLLIKGVLCALIGLTVLISPYFLRSPELQSFVSSASLVGWFGLMMGVTLLVRYAKELKGKGKAKTDATSKFRP